MKTVKTIIGCIMVALVLSALPLMSYGQIENDIQFIRPYDKYGINMFEEPKDEDKPHTEFAFKFGAAFTQQWQSLSQENRATPVMVDGVNINQLGNIGAGFNLATANLNLDVQLAEGIRVNVITYLSSRHHNEAWVKGGYLQIDRLPMFDNDAIENLMEKMRLKVGHFEVNYGDAHFRRSDNANALYNPFIGNYLMDSFTTEVGGEVYFIDQGFFGMMGLTGGQLRPSVNDPDSRSPSIYGKVGFDNRAGEGLRVRLTGSIYHNNNKTTFMQLYNSDRSGSRYYNLLEDRGSTRTPWSGRLMPDFDNGFTSFMINPFIKYEGFEIFGLYENSDEINTDGISVTQLGLDVLYRFGSDENFYFGGRYNYLEGELSGAVVDVSSIDGRLTSGGEASADRWQFGGGWFITKNILLKGEYVNQQYNDFESTSLYSGARFDGFVFEGVIAF